MRTVTVVTPWRNCREFIIPWLEAVNGADQIIVVDNNSDEETQAALKAAVHQNPLIELHRMPDNSLGYGGACNYGLERANGDIVVMLNNDVVKSPGPDWLDVLRNSVEDDHLYGASVNVQFVAGVKLPYIDGWCLAATRKTWETLGGFDVKEFKGFYWEDNDLSFRAQFRHGMKLRVLPINLQHLGNGTSSKHPEVYKYSTENRLRFEKRIQQWQIGRGSSK